MVYEDANFSEREAGKAEERRIEEFNDSQDKYAGRDNGRIDRFLTAEFREANDPAKKSERDQKQASRLQILLMQNARYAKLYRDTLEQLRQAEITAEQAIELAVKALGFAKDEYQSVLDRAAKLRNGTSVFKDEQGRVWTEHGVEVKGQALEEIVWRGGEPTRAEFMASQQRVQDTENNLSAWQNYQINTLGRIRNRLMDEKNPSTETEIEGFQSDMRNQSPIVTKFDEDYKSTLGQPDQTTGNDMALPKL